MTKIKDSTAELNFEGTFTLPEEYKSIKLMWLPISALIVDRAKYQRDPVAMKKIQGMANKWSYVICGLLTVMIRKNEKSYTVDGQQRALAAELKGITHLPCLVSMSSGAVEEALVFLGINRNRTAVMRVGVFKAAVAAKEEPAASIKAWADKCGLKIGCHGGGKGTFASVGALEKLWKLDEAAARQAMAVGARLVGESNEYLRNPVMIGLFWAIKDGIDVKSHLDKLLLEGGVTRIFQEARKISLGLPGTSVSTREVALAAVRGVINSKRSKTRV